MHALAPCDMSAEAVEHGLESDHDRRVTASPDRMSEASNHERSEEHTEGDGAHEDGTSASDTLDDDEEGEDEDEEDEGEDEDEEPALKYERLGGIAHQLLQKDSASMLAYANQRLVRLHTSTSDTTTH